MADRPARRQGAKEAAEAPHEYSIDRTVLANERTYAAWIRTGLTALAAGIAVEKLLAGIMAAWSIRGIAVILILYSALAFCLAAWRYTHLGIPLARADVKAVPVIVTTGASVALVLCSLLAFIDLWVTPPPA
jgi:inner membrane protein YidH